MAKNASHYVPTLRAGTEKIPADLLDLDGLEAGEVTIGDVEGLTDALAGKAASSHTHTAAQVDVTADAENGLSAGTLQAALESLAARVQAREDAAAEA